TDKLLELCAAVPRKPKRQLITDRSPWGDDVRAEALVLFNLGYSMRAAERAIKAKYGASPAFTTLWGWRKDADMMGLIREQSEALSARAGALIEEALMEIELEPEKRKYLIQLNAVRGTSVDKVLASPVEQVSGAQLNVTVNIDNEMVEDENSRRASARKLLQQFNVTAKYRALAPGQ